MGAGDNLKSFYRPTWAEISLDALQHNISSIRRIIPEQMKMLAVVKADAYGHGAIEVARHAVSCGVDYLAVAFLDEALELRAAGITSPILIMGYTAPEAVETAIEHNISFTVFSEPMLEALEQRANDEKKATIHIKIDTGMSRLGVRYNDDVLAFIDQALRISNVNVEGIYTHYARADEADKSFTIEQHRRFSKIIEHYRERGFEFPIVHAGNSATAIDMPSLSFNMIRLGISMYGLYPSIEINRNKVKLKPVMTFKTHIVNINMLPPNTGVSYGQTYHTQSDEQIATIPVGYADGFSRALSGDVEVLLRGQKVPIVGTICMDQCMVNGTGMDELAIGEEVVLFGVQGERYILADELASKLGTINYEITCQVSHRVPRVYCKDGQRVKVMNRLIREFR